MSKAAPLRAECSKTIEELKRELGSKLLHPEQIAPPPGLSTGWLGLDRFLLWHGFPKGAISLLVSEAGGATSLWVRSAAQVTRQGQWVAWVNDEHSSLTPWVLNHHHADLGRVLCVSAPRDARQVMWAIQELMALCLFEMIGCDLGVLRLSEPQLLKLKRLAARHQTALILTTRAPVKSISASCALVMQFGPRQVRVCRALHRPTPFALERRDLYADTLPTLCAGRRALCG